MQQACLRFEQYLKRRFSQSSTRKHYLSDLHIFITFIGNGAPEAVTSADIDRFVNQQIAAGMSSSTINRRLSCLHSFFEFLAGEQPDRHWPNPVVKRRHHLKLGAHLPRDASNSDTARLFAVITDERDQAMFGLMVGAGLRVGEVAALRLISLEPPAAPEQMARLRICGKGSKERVVWLTVSLWQILHAWLTVRPSAETDYLFLNRHGRPLSVSGIQYRLQQYCQSAGVILTCHQLRHTFARRLVEHGLPVDSLAKLLGHSQLQTTQRYIDGADPTVRADFAAAMAHLEMFFRRQEAPVSDPPQPTPLTQPRRATQAELQKLRERFADIPPWMAASVDAFLSWSWPSWRAQTATELGSNFLSLMRRFSLWLATHRDVDGWESLRRADLETWLVARQQEGVSNVTVRNDLVRLRGLLKFLEARGIVLDPGLFRVRPPKKATDPLPRYLPEAAYRQLETTILQATESDSFHASFDRAWFLLLAHTGMRLSELLDLRLDDLNLLTGYATVRGGKPGKDRVVYLTPPLTQALQRYLQKRPNLPDDDHVFVLHEHSPTARTLQRRLASYGQQAGVEVSPHQLRHTLATRLINQGMPIHSLRKLLGHEHLTTTQIYARIYDETLYRQFRDAISHLETIPVTDWPGVGISQRELVVEKATR